MSNITYIDGTYAYYRKLWKNDRWKFSNEMVRLTMSSKREGITAEEEHKLAIMNRIVDEHGGNWLEGNPTCHNGKPVKKMQPH